MTVKEIIEMTTDLNTVVVKDRKTSETLYNESYDGSFDDFDGFKGLKDLEVVGISARSLEELNVYVNAMKTCETYLDVVYSTKVTLTVPINVDECDAFQRRGEELVKLFPAEMKFGDVTFSLDDNNMCSGSFYDMIAER